MLTPKMTQLGPPPETAASKRAPSRTRRHIANSLKGLICVALFAQLIPSSRVAPTKTRTAQKRSDQSQQYLAGGTRWLDSRHDEVVHFICQGGTPYTISLDSASLREARIPVADHPRFLGALRTAVADWSALMGCNRFRVELDLPYPDTRIHFVPIAAPGTLATATRAGDITLNVRRDWFPGSRRHGNYGPNHRQVSFYWVVAHELGHVWGLAHSSRPDALMYPSQCRTCRWSSFEQAAGNVIRASSQAPAWSRPHYANRFFAKTPRTVVGRLLKGDLPSEPEADETAGHCESRTCDSQPNAPNAPNAPDARDARDAPDAREHDGCGAPDIAGAAVRTGWQQFRLPQALPDRQTPKLERQLAGEPPRRPHRGRDIPTLPPPGDLAAVVTPFDPGRRRWQGALRRLT